MSEHNIVTPLELATGFVDAAVVDRPKDLRVEGRTVVLNPTREPVLLAGPPARPLPPFSSTILVGAAVDHGERVVLLRVRDEVDATGIVTAPGWAHFADLLPGFPRDTGLYRGPRARIGTASFDPALALGQDRAEGVAEFDVWVNLWFSPAGTDCGIHDRHDFVEIHTQVHGYGRMQKFHADDHASLYEDQLMAPGHTPPVPFCRTTSDGFTYPWHQYRADTDCVWLAVEYHRTKG
jgi:hypothetical protein